MTVMLPPLALYLHLPWCVRKCPYCDFNSYEARGGLPEREYVAALLRDLDLDLPLAAGRPVETVFLGGGTPSLFSPESIALLLEGVRARVALASDAEITLEANPGTVEVERFRGYRAAGINRLSIGIQSFADAKLASLGRIHGRGEALAAAGAARDAGFDNFNLDLMFGLPGQTVEEALADIDQAIACDPAHLSVYQLTLEPETPFHARPPVLPPEDELWEMQERNGAALGRAGFVHYEVSAWARPGRECRHNLNYWTFGDYLGIGAGAHGKLTDSAGAITRRWKLRQPQGYLAGAGTPAALGGTQVIEPPEAAFEFMMNALRLTAGFDAALFEQRTGQPLASIEAALRAAEARDLLRHDRDRIVPTAAGRRYLNDLLLLFLPVR